MSSRTNRITGNAFPLFVLCAALAACGGNSNPNGLGPDGGPDAGQPDAGPQDGALQSLDLEPQNATLTINGTTTATQAYTLTATFASGAVRDVTGQSTFSVLDSSLGFTFNNQFTTDVTKGGTTQVVARYDGVTVATPVTIVKNQVFTSSGGSGGALPPDPSVPFAGPADASRAPKLVYPNDGVLVPPNLGQLEFHFLPGSSNTLFRLQFTNATTAVTVYLRCTAPDSTRIVKTSAACVYTPAGDVWTALAETNRGGDPVTVTVQGTDDTGTGVGSSASLRLSFSQEDLHGGLYYWTTSSFPGALPDGGSISTGIMRFDFAGSQAKAERYMDPTSTGASSALGQGNVGCLGCHALSRDGTKMVAEVNGQNDGRTLLWNLADAGAQIPFASGASSIFESWNPDGSQYVSADFDEGNAALRIVDGNTGAVVSTLSATGTSTNPADHPDWSASGQRIAYVKIGDTGFKNGAGDTGGTAQRMHHGAIEIIDRLADGGWSAPTELVPAATGKNNYYPAFAPDDSFLAYDTSTCTGSGDKLDISCNADTDPTATLFALPLDGGSPVALAAINAPGPLDKLSDGGVQTSLTDSFPKWSPFVTQRTQQTGTKVMWVTFSSTRRFGVYSPPSASGEAQLGVETFVWMAAVDPAKLAQGQDPSYPAFVLPFQDFTTSNHIAQWATQVVQGACVTQGNICDPNGSAASGTACCAGLTCQLGTGDPPVNTCQVQLH